MLSLRKWFISKMFTQANFGRSCLMNNILLQFYYADEELNLIAAELDTFDGRKDPVRCTILVNQLRTSQDKVITLIFRLMDEWHCERASRDYRLKFPDELLAGEGAESLNGQIWFGAECLAAGSNILNHETESAFLRPMAKLLTNTLDQLRVDLKNCCGEFEEREHINFEIVCKLEQFDRLFTSFEYEYVKAMLPNIKSPEEIEKQQDLIVLFSETLSSTLKRGLISQSDVDECQPKVMITVPRLAILAGLIAGDGSPICKKQKDQLSMLFKPFYKLLNRLENKIMVLRQIEIEALEKLLINEESLTNNFYDEEVLPSISSNINRKRCNSAPNSSQLRRSYSSESNLFKSASTLSMIPPLKTSKSIQTECNRKLEDNVSVDSNTTMTTTASDDSFEIALALDAKGSKYIPAQTRQLLHRLFVTISGVADQLQSNFASDMRNILKTVITLNSSIDDDNLSIEEAVEAKELTELSEILQNNLESETNGVLSRSTTLTDGMVSPEPNSSDSSQQESNSVFNYDSTQISNELNNTFEQTQLLLPPIWVPDELVSVCTLCSLQFTLIRRRHHCRNCGQIYCNNCSNHFIPLNHYGYIKPVRVCKLCYGQIQNVPVS